MSYCLTVLVEAERRSEGTDSSAVQVNDESLSQPGIDGDASAADNPGNVIA